MDGCIELVCSLEKNPNNATMKLQVLFARHYIYEGEELILLCPSWQKKKKIITYLRK